jgi:hypothetical protein
MEEIPEPPVVRGDCLPGGINEARPCQWTGCRYMMATKTGAGICVLDEADKGGLTLEEIAEMFGLTRERIRQIEAMALTKLRRRGTLHVLL